MAVIRQFSIGLPAVAAKYKLICILPDFFIDARSANLCPNQGFRLSELSWCCKLPEDILEQVLRLPIKARRNLVEVGDAGLVALKMPSHLHNLKSGLLQHRFGHPFSGPGKHLLVFHSQEGKCLLYKGLQANGPIPIEGCRLFREALQPKTRERRAASFINILKDRPQIVC